MSHAGAYRTLAAVVAAASLVSCKKPDTYMDAVGFTKPTGPIHINFVCGANTSIGLADANGNPAWIFETKKKDPMSWVVPANVTINAIVPKPGSDSLPLDPDGPQGGAPAGTPFKSKVKDSDKGKTSYRYNIDATCHPVTGPDVHLLIDPEMIVRR